MENMIYTYEVSLGKVLYEYENKKFEELKPNY